MFFCLKVHILPAVALVSNISTLGFLIYIFSRVWTDLSDKNSAFYGMCEWIHNEWNFTVDYSDIAMLLFWVFRLILMIFERVYDMFWYWDFSKNWNVCIDGKKIKRNQLLLLAFWQRMIDYDKILKDVQWNDRGLNKEQDTEIDVIEDELRSSYTFDPFLLSLFGLEKLWKAYRRKCYWYVYRKMSCNMHKTLLCMVLAISVSLIVNWAEESNMVMQSMSEDSCSKEGSFCLALNNIFEKDYDNCVCGKASYRSPVILVTVTLAACIGFYLTYRQILSYIFRHWLRFEVLPAVWVLVDPTTANCQDTQESEDISDSDTSVIIPDDSKKDQFIGLDIEDNTAQNKSGSTRTKKDSSYTRSEKRFTSTLTLDDKAFVDSAILIAGNKRQIKELKRELEEKLLSSSSKEETRCCFCFPKLICKLCKKLKQILYPNKDSRTMVNKILKKLIQGEYGKDIQFEDISRKVRNLLNYGTTMFSLEEQKEESRKLRHLLNYGTTKLSLEKHLLNYGTAELSLEKQKEESLLLIVMGSWTGGAFRANHPHLKGISVAATQHYVMSFSEGKSSITEVYDFSNRKVKKQKYHIGQEGVSFRRRNVS